MKQDREYEQLAATLAESFAELFGIDTKRCDHNVVMPGRGTDNQIDVVWEGLIDGHRHRVVIECKHHKRRVEQRLLHSFRSVLSDIADDVPTTGVFVTTQGYQSGAHRLAKTYGISILELRQPTDADLAGRVLQINLAINVTVPEVQGVGLEIDGGPEFEEQLEVTGAAELVFPDRTRAVLLTHLAALAEPSDDPATTHVVELDLPKGTMLADGARTVGPLKRARADVRFHKNTIVVDVGPGRNGISHVLHDSIRGAAFWIETDGSIHQLRD